MRRKFIYLFGILLALSSLQCKRAENAGADAMTPIVHTKYGDIQGVLATDSATIIYKGIPYAAPPVGDNRWRAPQPLQSWDTVMIADRFGYAAIQADHKPEPTPDGVIDYYKEFYQDGDPERSEDCLYLNIWTPANATPESNLPVAIWIHGGAFTGGFGHEIEFDGEAYAKRGVILVTINYRLGPLGFAAHPSLEENGTAGNYGILDQIAALDWVRDNISAFGGNPDNITIFGQSAGAMSVRTLLASPMTQGKVAKAIIQSGGGLHGIDPQIDLKAAEQQGLDIYGEMSAEQLRALPIAAIDSMAQAYITLSGQWMLSQPIKDGKVVVENFTDRALDGTLPDIPIMIGYCTQDMPTFMATDDYKAFADTLAAKGHKTPYIYQFQRQLPGDNCGAFHSSELWYVFNTLDNCWRPMTDADKELSERMVDYWSAFMRTGDPNDNGHPTWSSYTSETPQIMLLDIK